MAKIDPNPVPPDDVDEWLMPLRKPVSLGEVYSAVNLREPSAAEWLKWEKLTGVEANIIAIATLSGVPEPAVRQIGARDIVKAVAFLDRFF